MRLTERAANAEANASRALLASGYLRIYAPDGALLVEQRFADPAYRLAVGGVADAYPLQQVSAAVASGRATSYRAYMADGVTLIEEGSVGEGVGDVALDRAEIQTGAAVSLTRLTYRIPTE